MLIFLSNMNFYNFLLFKFIEWERSFWGLKSIVNSYNLKFLQRCFLNFLSWIFNFNFGRAWFRAMIGFSNFYFFFNFRLPAKLVIILFKARKLVSKLCDFTNIFWFFIRCVANLLSSNFILMNLRGWFCQFKF